MKMQCVVVFGSWWYWVVVVVVVLWYGGGGNVVPSMPVVHAQSPPTSVPSIKITETPPPSGSSSSINSSSSMMIGFTLVNSETDMDIAPLTIETTTSSSSSSDTDIKNTVLIDLALYGTDTPLTIRCDIRNTTATAIIIGRVEFNMDNGRIVRTENVAPYYLGGDTDGDADAVNTLRVIGHFTLLVSVFGGGDDSSSSSSDALLLWPPQEFTFSVVDTSIPDGTLSPTVTPRSIYDVTNYTTTTITGSIHGERKQWHKITVAWAGPTTSETNNIFNPFTDYRLDVTFTYSIGNDTDQNSSFVVPGFYACRGDAANSGAASGDTWLVHFRPDRVGNWTYRASFVQGINVALYTQSELVDALGSGAAEPALFFDGATGSFMVDKSDKTGRDLRGKGRLRYNPSHHHLQFLETGEYFLKAGADSPENFLAYVDFDDTPNNGGYRKDWSPHLRDYVDGDPTWSSGKGRGIIGAINYLSSTGMNAISFLTMNINGDDGNVYPYPSDSNFFRIDCSKTAQWDVVFDHAEHMGMFLHFKTQETENDQLLESEGEVFGNARKLYYRELIARFGHHLALNWNLGEENTNTDEQRKLFSDYIKDIDPYGHPIVVHTFPGQQEEVYRPLLGYENFDGVSLQTNPGSGFEQTLQWVNESAMAGRKWIVSYDEQGPATEGVVPDADDPEHNNIRRNVLWANLMAGGAGVEYYFGYSYNHSDLTAEDYRSRANMWNQSRYALEFFSGFPFWKMISANQLVSNNNWCLVDPVNRSAPIMLFLPVGDTLDIDLRGLQVNGTAYSIQWYDPRNGGSFQSGSIVSVPSDSISNIGFAPNSLNQDWAVRLQCMNCSSTVPTLSPTTLLPTSSSATSSPSAGIVVPSSVPSGTNAPSSTRVIPDAMPSAQPSSVRNEENNATNSSTGPFAPPSPNLPTSPPTRESSFAGVGLIPSVASFMMFPLCTLSCVGMAILTVV